MANSVMKVAAKHLFKRLVRPLLPKSLVSSYRNWRYHQVRHNVLVLLDDWRSAGRWLRSTPGTYRFERFDQTKPPPGFDVVDEDTGEHPIVAAGGGAAGMEMAVKGIAQSGLSVSFVARVRVPGRFDLRSREPVIEPIAMAAAREALEEIGGDRSDTDVASLYMRLRDTGREMALIPRVGPHPSSPRRRGAIDDAVICVLAGVPMHDVGGGSRATQLTLEMLDRGPHVVHISMFPTYETVDLGLRFVHPRLEQYSVSGLRLDALVPRVSEPGWVLVEVPSAEAVEWAEQLHQKGWRVCYDIVDLWSDRGLGGDWYRPELEARLIQMADLVTVSAPDLSALVTDGEATPVVIPNAVNAAFFTGTPGSRPPDLPRGSGPIFGYQGSLYGDWFDWEGLEEMARKYPESTVVLIGEASRGHPPMPGNVRFLGLKPQPTLRDYVSRFDVGLIPFRVSDTTHAVSPLKVYEYLACGVPVAAPPLRSLEGLDGVHTAVSLVDAVGAALEAPSPDPDEMLRRHSWANRVDALLQAMGIDSDGRSRLPAKVLVRPTVEYRGTDRIIE